MTDVQSEPTTFGERRTALWVTAVAALLAAALGSGVGGFFSYQASQRATRDQAAQSQSDFVRQQRQAAYLQAAPVIAAVQAAAHQAVFDSLPFGAGVTGPGDLMEVSPTTGPGTNSIAQLNTSLPAFEEKNRQLAGLNATIAIVGSTQAASQYQSLVQQYTNLDAYLVGIERRLASMPATLTAAQILSIAPDFKDENQIEHDARSTASQFEQTARVDLDIH